MFNLCNSPPHRKNYYRASAHLARNPAMNDRQ
jgi:hypothetical protein